MAESSRRDDILDSAERLFAYSGYYGVSLRDIAADAGVELALIQYHFKAKNNLIEEVVKRRAGELIQARAALLDQAEYEAAPGSPGLQAILNGLLRPMFEFAEHGGDGWRAHLQLLANLAFSPEWDWMATKYYDEMARRIFVMLRRAFPKASEVQVATALHFVYATTLPTFTHSQRMTRLTGYDLNIVTLNFFDNQLIPFLMAGVTTTCRPGQARKLTIV